MSLYQLAPKPPSTWPSHALRPLSIFPRLPKLSDASEHRTEHEPNCCVHQIPGSSSSWSPFAANGMPRYSLIRHPYCAAISQQAGLTTTMELDVDFAEDADLRKSIGVHVKIISSLIKPFFPQPGLKHYSHSTTLSDPDTVKFLNAVNVVANKVLANSPLSRLPHLTFSFGRGLQSDAMQKWVKGDTLVKNL
ncbi:hypothetical protein DFJ58DRAFT_836977 [Suillus subalutaceus]|uniref:uncharacterized protein n=1 Tax=Suillus subalutaceus TaxID=48586 RepID=UPI001B8815AD|nr:uncharacterized protein DFJ58DRAFT_836977 [Suillus subalutaceus]KAG1872425.1 hypothetical protein DFJ58DRAFT_836977 [Suillus subalutaceus]